MILRREDFLDFWKRRKGLKVTGSILRDNREGGNGEHVEVIGGRSIHWRDWKVLLLI